MFSNWKDSVGTMAAVCTTIAFVPQIIKVHKSGGRDLSYPMLFFYLVGLVLWLFYGLIIRAPEVIWANVITACLVIVCIGMKWNFERISPATTVGALAAGKGQK
jgi:MtN3 and saliva related transmembrane protein